MELSERLKRIRKDNGYTRERLAQELGLSYGTVAKYETGEREPGHGYIVKLAQKFGLTTDYVLGIEKPKPAPLPYSAAALDLARQYDRLDSWGQAAVSAIVREETARCEAPAAELAEIIELPHSLLSASAGTGQWLDDDTADIWEVRLNEHTRKADFAVDVAGDSMEPLYSDGDTVLVHAQPAINKGEVGLYVYRGDGYIKRQGDGCLHSLNPRYPDIVPCDGEAIVCKGLVLGKLAAAWIVSK